MTSDGRARSSRVPGTNRLIIFKMNELLLLFIVLNVVNVILQTFKTLCTVNGGKYTASLINALAYGFYTIIVIYMMCDLPILTKAVVIGLCNLVGVFIVKYIEERRLQDKLWKIEFTVKSCCFQEILNYLDTNKIPYNYTKMPQSYIAFYAFCQTRAESEKVKKLIDKYGAKYFIAENKSLL